MPLVSTNVRKLIVLILDFGGESNGIGSNTNGRSLDEATAPGRTEDMVVPLNFPQQHGEFQRVHSLLVDGGDRYGVSSVTIDLSEELIWVGNQGVRYLHSKSNHLLACCILKSY